MRIKDINAKYIKDFLLGTPFPIPVKDMGFTIHLDRKVKTDAEPLDRNLVLRLNSSFLEMTDTFYIKQGWFLFGVLLFTILSICWFLFGVGSLFRELFTEDNGFHRYSLLWNIFSVAIIIVLTLFFGFMALALSNALISLALSPGTHTPIRFCRKTQRVYGFVRLGSFFIKRPKMFNAAWENTHFYLKRGSFELWPKGSGEYDWDLVMVELNEDGDIVNEMHLDRVMGNEERDFYLLGQWEMIRRYMEEGPQSFPLPEVMLPIAFRKETFWEGWLVVYRSQSNPSDLFFAVLGFLLPLPGFSRMLHKWIAKIPQWPNYVGIEHTISSKDPYRYEGGKNGAVIHIPPKE